MPLGPTQESRLRCLSLSYTHIHIHIHTCLSRGPGWLLFSFFSLRWLLCIIFWLDLYCGAAQPSISQRLSPLHIHFLLSRILPKFVCTCVCVCVYICIKGIERRGIRSFKCGQWSALTFSWGYQFGIVGQISRDLSGSGTPRPHFWSVLFTRWFNRLRFCQDQTVAHLDRPDYSIVNFLSVVLVCVQHNV